MSTIIIVNNYPMGIILDANSNLNLLQTSSLFELASFMDLVSNNNLSD